MRLIKPVLAVMLWSVVVLCLAVTALPHFLDRIYYRGPVSGHYDGARFFNPDGADTEISPAARNRMLARRILGDGAQPAWPAHVAVTPARPPAGVGGSRMLATWVGHATVLVQTGGLNILTDPVWSRRAGPFGIGPARVADPGIRFEDLPRIDLVLVSHDHYDHMDLATLRRLWERDKPLVVTSLGNGSVLAGAKVPSQALDWGEAITLTATGAEREEGVPRCDSVGACPGDRATVTVTRNHHWGSRWFADRNRALWSSFVVRVPGGNIFFAGDTGLGDGKWPSQAAALGPIRLAILPIGAFRFEEGQMASGSHIGPQDALRVWNGLGRPYAIGVHWGTFRLSREGYDTPPRLLRAMLDCAESRGFAAVPIGQTVAVPPIGTPPPRPDFSRVAACARAGAFDALR